MCLNKGFTRVANNNMNNGLRNAKVSAPSMVDVIVAELVRENIFGEQYGDFTPRNKTCE